MCGRTPSLSWHQRKDWRTNLQRSTTCLSLTCWYSSCITNCLLFSLELIEEEEKKKNLEGESELPVWLCDTASERIWRCSNQLHVDRKTTQDCTVNLFGVGKNHQHWLALFKKNVQNLATPFWLLRMQHWNFCFTGVTQVGPDTITSQSSKIMESYGPS